MSANTSDLLSGQDKVKFDALCDKGRKQLEAQNYSKASKHYLAAWNMAPEDKDMLTIIAFLMRELGARTEAIGVLEKLVAIKGGTPEVLDMAGGLANEMGMPDFSEKFFQIYVNLYPNDPVAYRGLASALGQQEKYDESIALLQSAIPMFPENVSLWNVLSSLLIETGKLNEAEVFYKEAIRIDPKDFRLYNNYSLLLQGFDRNAEAEKLLKKSVRINSKHPEPRTGLGVLQLLLGNFREGWKNYRARSENLSASGSAHYITDLKTCREKNLENKTVFLMAEQGIGDEILFAWAFPAFLKQTKAPVIGCDKRLIPLFERTFPDATVGSHATVTQQGYLYRAFPDLTPKIESGEIKADCRMIFGEVAARQWRNKDDLQLNGEKLFKLDEDMVSNWKARLEGISKRPKIGISWTSGRTHGTRKLLYQTIKDLKPILETKGVDFINVQYGDVKDDIAFAKKEFGITIHDFDDLDLFNDIDSQMAMMSELDIVIGPASAPTMFAAAAGTPVWWMLRSVPWWAFGQNKPPFGKNCKFMTARNLVPWIQLTSYISTCLKRFVDTGDAAGAVENTPKPEFTIPES